MAKSIAVVGAGAKAAAIAARAAVLRDLRDDDGVPNIQVFEKDHVGAAWSGDGRFSSGFLRLCTPGEKDVGFPYVEIERREGLREPVALSLFANFSWLAYLVATGRFTDWVDRGRNYPRHREWRDYLAWVFDAASQEVTIGEVTGVRPHRNRWEVAFQQEGVRRTKLFDGVVLTGAGRAKAIPCSPDVPKRRILDGESFWPARDDLLELQEGTIIVAGDGGAAGAIIAWLSDKFVERRVSIVSVNPMGTLFLRGDGHSERRWFSDPSDWGELNPLDRRKLIERTEAGVVSMLLKSAIDQNANVEYRCGRAVEVNWDGSELNVQVEYDGSRSPMMGDYLISAIGFDSWSRLELVDHPQAALLCGSASDELRRQVELDMRVDLSLPPISGLPPGLHVPALAALARGPGMGNLGCLGLMSAAVLRTYL